MTGIVAPINPAVRRTELLDPRLARFNREDRTGSARPGAEISGTIKTKPEL